MGEAHNITMPPEEMKEWNGMNGGKLHLERARLQEMLERSCWIINNERTSLLWAYGKLLKIEAKFCHSRKRFDWIYITRRREAISPGG